MENFILSRLTHGPHGLRQGSTGLRRAPVQTCLGLWIIQTVCTVPTTIRFPLLDEWLHAQVSNVKMLDRQVSMLKYRYITVQKYNTRPFPYKSTPQLFTIHPHSKIKTNHVVVPFACFFLQKSSWFRLSHQNSCHLN